jgi:hypothetical protein
MENTNRDMNDLTNSLVSLALGEKVEEEKCILPQYRTTIAQKHAFAEHVSSNERNHLPIEWVIDIQDESNGWFYGTAYHFDDTARTLHVIVPDKSNPTFDGQIELDHRAVRLVECVDGKSNALFNKIVRDSVVRVNWEVDWFDESELGLAESHSVKGTWIASSAWYYIRMTNQLLVEDENFQHQESRAFVLITADKNLKLLNCHKGKGIDDFARLIDEGVVQSSPKAAEVARSRAQEESTAPDDVVRRK